MKIGTIEIDEAGASTIVTGNVVVSGSIVSLSSNFGTYNQRPSTGFAGQRYVAIDSSNQDWVHDGTIWRPLVKGTLGYEPPLASSFIAFNAGGTAAMTQLSGTLQVVGNNEGASVTIRGWTVALPAGNQSYVECAFAYNQDPTATSTGWSAGQLLLRESATSKSLCIGSTFDHNTSGVTYYEVMGYSNDTTRTLDTGAAIPNTRFDYRSPTTFWRLRRDATNIYCELSYNRMQWMIANTIAIASAFTTAPDRCGVSVFGYNFAPKFEVMHFTSGTY